MADPVDCRDPRVAALVDYEPFFGFGGLGSDLNRDERRMEVEPTWEGVFSSVGGFTGGGSVAVFDPWLDSLGVGGGGKA